MTPRKRSHLWLLLAVLLPAGAPRTAAAQPSTFNREAWLQDYNRLKVALAQGYANLDWQVDHRGFRLQRADAAINAMLSKVRSDAEAAIVFTRLLEGLDDPHLQLLPGPPPEGAKSLPARSQTIDAGDCGSGGTRASRLPYARTSGWTPVAEKPFRAGLIGTTGVLHVPSFDESRYPESCAAAAKRGMSGRQRQLATRAKLDQQLGEAISALRARGMERLIIDLTGNGGGSEWSSEIAARFFAGTLRRMEPRRVGPGCDRIAIWRGEPAPCSIYEGPPREETISDTPYWTGPLVLLVDRHTASAAEEFAGWLHDNDRALIAGERTAGAGCGYIDGGNVFVFRAAPIHLMMPNCSRYTRAGVNEIEGRAVDIAVDWATLQPEAVPDVFSRLFRR